jgi:exportin-1
MMLISRTHTTIDIAAAYDDTDETNQTFIQNLAMFFTTILSRHLPTLEAQTDINVVLTAHRYLIKISQVDERELFKVCLEYWLKFVADLYNEIQRMPLNSALLGMSGGDAGRQVNLRRNTYSDILKSLRVVMIENMVKPEEVLIVENDDGEIVREFVKESDTLAMYKSMRECLVYLTHLDTSNMESIMLTKLARQMDGSEWSWNNLNKLCWAVGSISGAMSK